MAAFPDVKFTWPDLGLQTDSVIERTDVERGIPKQRRFASDARVEVSILIIHDTKAQAEAFEDWFFDDINAGADWFDFTRPDTGTVVQARIVDGQLGKKTFDQPSLEASRRPLTIEFWRSTW